VVVTAAVERQADKDPPDVSDPPEHLSWRSTELASNDVPAKADELAGRATLGWERCQA